MATDHNELPAFSRASSARGEKLTIVTPLSVRLTESQAHDVQGLADLHGMEKGEYIRHLVEQDKLEQHKVWLARNQLFSSGLVRATHTTHDGVAHE